MQKQTQQLRFLFYASILFLIVSSIVYLPVFRGRVPIPARLVTQFPAWESTASEERPPAPGVDYGDLVTFFYPWRILSSSVLHQYEIPLWNPHILGGTPLVASAQAGIFYPIHLALAILPVPAAWSLKLFLNVFLAGLLTAIFVRSLGARAVGALTAGVSYALCGFITGWQGQAIADAALWLPLICWSVNAICKRPSPLPAAAGACAFALPVLAGHPETAAHVTVAGSLYFFWLALAGASSRHFVFRRFIWFGIAALAAMGLAAVQILPTIEWLGQITHSLNIDWGSLDRHELLAFFSRDLSKTPNSSNIHIPEATAYAGIITLLLAPFALLRRSRRDALFFLILVVLTLQIVGGWGPGYAFTSHAPVLRGIKNWRMLGVTDFSLAVLAGLGASCLYERRSRAGVRTWVLTAAAFFVVSLGIWELREQLIAQVSWWRGPFSAAVLLAAAAAVIVFRLADRIGPRTFALTILPLVCFDLITYAFGYVTFARPREIFPPAPVFTFLREHHPETDRVVNLHAYTPNAEMVYGIQGVGGWEISLKLVNRLLNDFSEPVLDAVRLDTPRVLARSDRRLDMMNARYFVTHRYDENFDLAAADPERFQRLFSDGSVSVFENRRALPRAWFVPAVEGAIEILPGEIEQLARLRDKQFDPQHSVILQKPLAELEVRPQQADRTRDEGPITWEEVGPNHQTLRIDPRQPGLLVLSQIFYPGWSAFVDGVPQNVLRADYALMGVPLAAGHHAVRFEFRPRSVRIGAAVTGVSLVLLIGISSIGLVWRRRAVAVPDLDVDHEELCPLIREAARRRPAMAIAVSGLIVAAMFGLTWYTVPIAFDPSGNPPELVLSATEVRAGEDSYILQIKDRPNATVAIQYSLDNEEPQVFMSTLDSDGAVRFEVGAETRKGTYRILAFRDIDSSLWFAAKASVVVR
jgi:hypothetical protein